MADDTDISTLRRILHDCRRIAVVGISAEWHRPSYFVGKYMLEHGYTMIPVNPKYSEVLGQRCYADLQAARAAGPIDMVDCFRRSEDIRPLAEQAIASAPIHLMALVTTRPAVTASRISSVTVCTCRVMRVFSATANSTAWPRPSTPTKNCSAKNASSPASVTA